MLWSDKQEKQGHGLKDFASGQFKQIAMVFVDFPEEFTLVYPFHTRNIFIHFLPLAPLKVMLANPDLTSV